MRAWVFGIVAAVLVVNALPARADDGDYYGAVVCAENSAMVRFAPSGAPDEIEFAPPPAPYARLFGDVRVEDPSECRLRDGRVVTLHQSYDLDAKPYGAGGAISTQWFTLTIGDRVIYDHEVFDSRAEPRADLVVIFDGRRLTECRTQSGDPWTVHEIPLSCTDQSSKLPGAPLTQAIGPPRFEVTSFADGREAFCNSLLQPNTATFTPGTPWPTYVSPYPFNMVSFGTESETPSEFDINNDGVIDRPIMVSFETHYLDGQFWMLPPAGATPSEAESNAARDTVSRNEAATLRQAGWQIFAGDQTVFGEPRYVWLQPAFRDGQTYFAAWWATLNTPAELVLRPRSDGSLEQICEYNFAR